MRQVSKEFNELQWQLERITAEWDLLVKEMKGIKSKVDDSLSQNIWIIAYQKQKILISKLETEGKQLKDQLSKIENCYNAKSQILS